ncbi:cobalt-precorrin-5B (C(1))-methyltransferase [Rhodovibrionaceae bacterium A322]
MARIPEGPLRRGWTTGACATAATRAAYTALVTGEFPDPVSLVLPKGDQPSFALAFEGKSAVIDAIDLESGAGLASRAHWAQAGIIKDAGDDPDVTHGALVLAKVTALPAGQGIRFVAGKGVGTVTLPGLPIEPGEAAINPVPRRLMREQIAQLAQDLAGPADVEIEISIPDGEALAQKTWNPRLGILGGLSILGTTGVVHPFSCSAWIHSIHRGIDVARATGLTHVGGATGSTSEEVMLARHGFSDVAVLDMGDFAGGLLKYLRDHPVARLTLAGGFAKMTKLAQGFMDLHSGRSQVDFDWLAEALAALGARQEDQDRTRQANTAMQVLGLARDLDLPLGQLVAERARDFALDVLRGAPVEVEILVVDRQGQQVGLAGALPRAEPETGGSPR